MRRHRSFRIAVHALGFWLIAGYSIFAIDVATCLEHTAGAHRHSGATTHHHMLCGETQCSGAAILTDGLSAPADLPRLSGAVAPAVVSPITQLFQSFSPSRAPPLSPA
jgi:hypothetical protein